MNNKFAFSYNTTTILTQIYKHTHKPRHSLYTHTSGNKYQHPNHRIMRWSAQQHSTNST